MKVFALVLPDDDSAGDAPGFVAAAAGLAQSLAATPEVLLVGTPGHDVPPGLLAQGLPVTVASHDGLATPVQSGQLMAALAEALAAVGAGDPQLQALVLFPACALGDELAARCAVRLGGSALGRCDGMRLQDGVLTGQRAAFGGRLEVGLRALRFPAFATLRSGRTDPAPLANADSGTVTRLALTGKLPAPLEIALEATAGQAQRLETARIVVCGGRGMGGPEGFAQLDALAGALGGALGGSLPAVDAGWVPITSQVGQSGKYVTPEVYVAVGISGTLQHLAGIGPQVRIVAINNDPEATIFREAQLGLVADWREVLPLIVERVAAGEPAA